MHPIVAPVLDVEGALLIPLPCRPNRRGNLAHLPPRARELYRILGIRPFASGRRFLLRSDSAPRSPHYTQRRRRTLHYLSLIHI